jgi:hypothetical protein
VSRHPNSTLCSHPCTDPRSGWLGVLDVGTARMRLPHRNACGVAVPGTFSNTPVEKVFTVQFSSLTCKRPSMLTHQSLEYPVQPTAAGMRWISQPADRHCMRHKQVTKVSQGLGRQTGEEGYGHLCTSRYFGLDTAGHGSQTTTALQP